MFTSVRHDTASPSDMKINSDWLKWIVLRLIDLDLSYRYLNTILQVCLQLSNLTGRPCQKNSARKHVDIWQNFVSL